MNIRSVCVYGPAGSGKSKHAYALANMFGLTVIVDEPWPEQGIRAYDTLYLSQTPVGHLRSVTIASALKMLELE